MFSFRLDDGPGDAGAAVGALENEIDLLHAPMGLNIADMHGNTQAAGAYHHGLLEFVVLDISWHGGSPRTWKRDFALDPIFRLRPLRGGW
jgi:hypothetical protein